MLFNLLNDVIVLPPRVSDFILQLLRQCLLFLHLFVDLLSHIIKSLELNFSFVNLVLLLLLSQIITHLEVLVDQLLLLSLASCLALFCLFAPARAGRRLPVVQSLRSGQCLVLLPVTRDLSGLVRAAGPRQLRRD